MLRTAAGLLLGSVMGTALALSSACNGSDETPVGAPTDAGTDVTATATDAGASDDADANVSSSPGDEASTFMPPPGLPSADKIDILFDIDNSASMGDKQEYFAQAIPDLIARFVTPNCVDGAGTTVYGPSDASGQCARGRLEFPPIRDIHLGVVSSSLGPRLGNACPGDGAGSTVATLDAGAVARHNDDRGELLNRGSDPANLGNLVETVVGDTGTMHFLDWAPGAASDAGTDPPIVARVERLESDFQSLVAGTHYFGCGIESQLESWYRFLVQPDPYDSLAVVVPDAGPSRETATWVGVDKTILAQRRAFLRPDSLVLVVVLTDENDSEIDVRSFGGSAYHFMDTRFAPPRGTSACATNVNDTVCTSCAFGQNPTDSECMKNNGTYPVTALNDWGYDLNLRHVHMKQKYGVSVQFPIQRYALGLSSPNVPDRNGEYPPDAGAGTDPSLGGYQGLTIRNCTNPLFAAALPDGTDVSAATLCHLPPGTRTPDRVYYMHIGGVPHQLLQADPTNPDSPAKDTLSDADWVKILGKDPLTLDTTGIDPHMIESYAPRPGLSTTVDDPISGHEWVTDTTATKRVGLTVDREYACIFKLPQPRDCSDANDPIVQNICDCSTVGLSPDALPPICNPAVPTQQVYAKAYPTIRELLLAKLLGAQGIVSSLCPIHATDQSSGHDPLYGYRPAIHLLVNRVKPVLGPPPPQ